MQLEKAVNILSIFRQLQDLVLLPGRGQTVIFVKVLYSWWKFKPSPQNEKRFDQVVINTHLQVVRVVRYRKFRWYELAFKLLCHHALMTNCLFELNNLHFCIRRLLFRYLLRVLDNQLPKPSSNLGTILFQVGTKQIDSASECLHDSSSLVLGKLEIRLQSKQQSTKQSSCEVSKRRYHSQNFTAALYQVFFSLNFTEILLLSVGFLFFDYTIQLWNQFLQVLWRFSQDNRL